MLNYLCSDCKHGAWSVTNNSLYAIAFWIIIPTILAYLLVTWSNKYIDPSVNLAYTALQPISASILSHVLIMADLVKECKHSNDADGEKSNCLNSISTSDLGAFAVVFGLFLVVFSDAKYLQNSRAKQVKEYESELWNETQ